MGLPKHRRLRQPKEFRHVLNSRRRVRDGLVAVVAARNNLPDQPSRFGFSVSRRVGGAVVRNRVKRRLRAIMQNTPTQDGLDIVVTAFPNSATSESRQLAASVSKLSKRLGIQGDQHHRNKERHDG